MATSADPSRFDRRPGPATGLGPATRPRGRRGRGPVNLLGLLLLGAVLVGGDLAHGQAGRPSAAEDQATAEGQPGAGDRATAEEPAAAGSRAAPDGRVAADSRVAADGRAAPAATVAVDGGPDHRTPGPDHPTSGPGYPTSGPGTFGYAPGAGPVLGTAGPLRRYRVATERRIGQDPAAFAATVAEILGDPRGWTASRRLRLQRVSPERPADFTVFLASPASSERMCAAGGLHTERYTSCRLPGQVIINLARWMEAVPAYGAPLAVYRAYAVNHEVGHELGYGHEACPGHRRPAPVMQQQTYGLRGCLANGWPYPAGRRYSGPPIP